MNALAERLGARINLVVLKAGNISSVEWVESTTPLRVDIGTNAPMAVHCTASGKLLMAFGPNDLQKNFLRLAPFPARTKKTITTARGFARELDPDPQARLCRRRPGASRASTALRCRSTIAPARWSPGSRSWRWWATLPLEKLRGHLAEICQLRDDDIAGTRRARRPAVRDRRRRATAQRQAARREQQRGAARARSGHATAPPATR